MIVGSIASGALDKCGRCPHIRLVHRTGTPTDGLPLCTGLVRVGTHGKVIDALPMVALCQCDGFVSADDGDDGGASTVDGSVYVIEIGGSLTPDDAAAEAIDDGA